MSEKMFGSQGTPEQNSMAEYYNLTTEQRKQSEERRWGKIQDLFNEEEKRQGHELSDFEKLTLIQIQEGRDWDTLSDIRKLGASGYFAAAASNIEKHVVGEIRNGEIFENNEFPNNLNAYGADSSGQLFSTWNGAKAWADEQE